MAGAWTVFRREMGGYFASPVAYLIAAAFLLVTGLIFNNDLTVALGSRPANLAAVPQLLAFAMVFFAPLLTMRLLAEESREGTMELLLTAPVQDGSIVIGKFLSAWVFYTILLIIPFVVYQIIIQNTGNFPDMGHAVSAYLGIWLYGGAALSVGLMFSAVTDNQVIAAFLSMSFLLLMWLGDLAGQIVGSVELANLVRKLTLQGHFSASFAAGIFRAEDVAYYAGIIVVMLFITIRIVESRRWR
jgi:ABC-2 type transport system permease protein